MKVNELYYVNNQLYRILAINENGVLVINCNCKSMPKYKTSDFFSDAVLSSCLYCRDIDELSPKDRRLAIERYSYISSAVAVVENEKKRSYMLKQASEMYSVDKQTLRSYLCKYLTYMNIAALAPKPASDKELTSHQKNMRWALNKYYYNLYCNSLNEAYTLMLKEKYCGDDGTLVDDYPTFNQFRYFFRKTRKLENYYISRNGLTDYQRNNRPLFGCVQDFAPTIGTAMLDSTVCDIYLVDEAGRLIGRPIMVAAVDANSSLCLGFSVLLEGGVYSLNQLLLNILCDKVDFCKSKGISITHNMWPNCNQLPAVMVTDGGREYTSSTFSQIADLGISIVNLPPYRPELKSCVEKLMDLIQDSYKVALKGKGVIMPDYQERGSHDYRKDACITLSEFERIIVNCIVFYNSKRILSNYPYTDEMMENNIKPHANCIWNYGIDKPGATMITVSKEQLILTLLPRTTGHFSRFGLKVNKLRYYADGYKERFLSGGDAVVAYNPDNCSFVWLLDENGSFVRFNLTDNRFKDLTIDEAKSFIDRSKKMVESSVEEEYQAKIDLIKYIETIAAKDQKTVTVKDIKKNRRLAEKKIHIDIGAELDD